MPESCTANEVTDAIGASVPTTNEEPVGLFEFVVVEPVVTIPLVQPAISSEPAASAKIDGRKVLPSILGRIGVHRFLRSTVASTEPSLELGAQKQHLGSSRQVEHEITGRAAGELDQTTDQKRGVEQEVADVLLCLALFNPGFGCIVANLDELFFRTCDPG